MNLISAVAILWFFLLDVRLRQVEACSPGPSSKVSSHNPRVSTPLNLKQRVPDVSEQTLGASGAAEEPIARETARFRELLVENANSDIQFKDEEGTGADRLMTQRCKDKLNTLAISVMNEWPGVRLRVLEAWDEDGVHGESSLHYEGRAVQITTSDRDKTKYGRLARLAVEAGFDWVSYSNKNYVHCSVQSGTSAESTGNCFHKMSKVTLSSGEERPVVDLKQGDRVMVVFRNGSVGYSEIILIMDRRPDQRAAFLTLHTEDHSLTLTPEHLVYVSSSNSSKFSESVAVFGSAVRKGDYLHVLRKGGVTVRPERVTRVTAGTLLGAVAPLTEEGSIVIDGVAASSYAVIRDEWIAHLSFAPLRWIRRLLPAQEFRTEPQLHWYPRYLYKLAGYLVNSRLYEGFVLPD